MTEKKSMLDGEKQYHIGLAPGDVADFVILPGDPGRVEFIAGHFDDDGQRFFISFLPPKCPLSSKVNG